MESNTERIVVVTGASRGAGKGIAVALGQTGATVYVTGRTAGGTSGALGTVDDTAAAVTAAGGTGVAVVCDHSDDEQVRRLFERIESDHGRLDILVNNATALPDGLTERKPFWEKSLEQVDILDVGMRSHYVATYYAAPLLVAAGGGLVVNTSSPGGRCYMHGPAYGSGKAAVDKMAHDMAHDFEPYSVAVVSIWMGLLLTEQIQAGLAADPDGPLKQMAAIAEHPEFTGFVIDALANDPDRMSRSGQVSGWKPASEYDVTDVDGSTPSSHREWLGPPTTYSDAIVE